MARYPAVARLLPPRADGRPAFASSLDPSSENWVVLVDNEHCADAGETDLPPNELFMLLDPSSVTFVFADKERSTPSHETAGGGDVVSP